jgi:anaerobic dimethyl sulfoxide reductase subunit C (anchor subunit)
MKDRSLVVFTIFSQTAVGSFWVLGALNLWSTNQSGILEGNALFNRIMLVVVLNMVLGLLTSFFHLGTPYRAWRALTNLRSSWLSREILFALMFTGVSALFTALQWLGWGSIGTRSLTSWVAAVSGLALIYSMANTYQLRTIPAWNTWVTVGSFFTTTLLLGMLLVVESLLIFSDSSIESLEFPLYSIGISMIILLFVQITITSVWITRLSRGQESALRTVERLTRDHSTILGLRFGSALAGILAIFLSLTSWGNDSVSILTALAFIMVLGSELLGRMLFYVARERSGI